MKDFKGQEVEVGDTIVTIVHGYRSDYVLKVGK